MCRKTKGGRKFHLTFPSGLNVYKFFICIRSLASFLQRPFCLGEGSFPKNRLSGATNIVIICRTNKKSGSFSAIFLSFNIFIFNKIAYLYNLKYEKVAFVADSVSGIFRFRIFLENAGGWRSEDFNAGFFRLGRNCMRRDSAYGTGLHGACFMVEFPFSRCPVVRTSRAARGMQTGEDELADGCVGRCKTLTVCVIPARFERATHSLEGCCSIQLSYGTVFVRAQN